MTINEVDNMINRINKKADRILATLGARSSLYGRTASIMSSLKEFGLVERNKKTNRYKIKRGKAVSNLSQKDLNAVVDRLKMIETQMAARSLSKEKAVLRETIKTIKGTRKLGRVTINDYKRADAIVRSAGEALKHALDYFYTFDPNSTSSEAKAAMKIVHQPGRRTFDEMRTVIELARKHMQRTNTRNTVRLRDLEQMYDLGDDEVSKFYRF